MSLLKYFKLKLDSVLPNPNGYLSKVIPSSSIIAANEAVKHAVSQTTKTRGPYVQFTAEEKARMGKRAAECGIASTVRYFNKIYSDREVKESSVRTWMNKYKDEISKRKRGEIDINELPDKKRGRRLLLGEELDRQVQLYILDLRDNGAVINSTITMAVAQGIINNFDSNLLLENGEHINLTKTWAKYLLQRLGFVKRRSSTKAKVSPSVFSQLQEQFGYDAKVLIEMMEIPNSLVINWGSSIFLYQNGQWKEKALNGWKLQVLKTSGKLLLYSGQQWRVIFCRHN